MSAITPSRRDASVLLLGGALFAAGFILGGLSRPAAALAQPGHGGTDFGFGVPAQGFALVKGADGGAYVVSPRGDATRVLVAINPGASDQPKAGSTGHLALD